jgi:4-amino-4-deoxy-L-arabinose transferase-like glycosyltransferase
MERVLCLLSGQFEPMRILSILNANPHSLAIPQSDWRFSAWAERLVVAAILLIFVGFGVGYSLTVPPFETPDEIHHYAFARHLAAGNALPVQTVEGSGPWEHEGTQAPLYYLLLGWIIAGIDQSDFESVNTINPHANLGNPLYAGNKNYMLYSAVDRPLTGAILAVYLGRWFSLALMICTLLLVYAIARLAFPGDRVLPALVLLTVAAIPQIQFISATVSNDNMVILCSTAGIFWLARLVARPVVAPIRWYEWAILGAILGLAALSKLHGLGLIPLTGLVVLALAWLRRDGWLPLRALLPIALPILVIAGWWYWRNYVLYGEWLGVDQLLSINGQRTAPQTVAQWWGELRGVRYSFWGLFGWFSILMPPFIYTLLDGISILALVGVIGAQVGGWRRDGWAHLHRSEARVHLLLLVWAAMLVALLFYWLTFATSGQGRLLFPAIGAFGVFLCMGICAPLRLLPQRWRLPLFLILPAGLLTASLYSLLVLMPASYEALRPIQPTVAVGALPSQDEKKSLIFGDQIELVAADVSADRRYGVGDAVEVTLYWRALTEISENYPLFVQLISPGYETLGNITTHPGWGRFPTTLWKAGEIYADRYQLQVERVDDNRSPLLSTLTVGFFEPVTGARLPARTADGQILERAEVARVEIQTSAASTPPEMTASDANFGDIIQLRGFRFPTQIEESANDLVVTLHWEAIQRRQSADAASVVDTTAFVHLVDANGVQVSGYDQAPAQGRFPTSRWQPGDRSLSDFPLPIPANLPAGLYEIWVGLYADQEGYARLPILSSLHRVQDQRLLLGTVQIGD